MFEFEFPFLNILHFTEINISKSCDIKLGYSVELNPDYQFTNLFSNTTEI